jgi:hypothetical protein
MTVVMERIEAVSCRDELFESSGLFFSQPGLRLSFRKIFAILEPLLVRPRGERFTGSRGR